MISFTSGAALLFYFVCTNEIVRAYIIATAVQARARRPWNRWSPAGCVSRREVTPRKVPEKAGTRADIIHKLNHEFPSTTGDPLEIPVRRSLRGGRTHHWLRRSRRAAERRDSDRNADPYAGRVTTPNRNSHRDTHGNAPAGAHRDTYTHPDSNAHAHTRAIHRVLQGSCTAGLDAGRPIGRCHLRERTLDRLAR